MKVGVVSCSGETCVEGTISRIAVRLVLEQKFDETVTICLPLFLAGGEGERMFAKEFPTIAVDGCTKLCAKKAIEKYSGKTAGSIVVEDLLKEWNIKSQSRRELDAEGMKAAQKVADVIAAEIDELRKRNRRTT